MSGALTYSPRRPRRSSARRQVYRRRRFFAVLLLLALSVGAYFGVSSLLNRLFPATAALPFQPEKYLTLKDRPERIAVSPADKGLRQLLMVTGSEKRPKPVGQPVTVPDFPVEWTDLPRAQGVVLLKETLPSRGEPRPVTVGGERALEAAGGEPFYRAWHVDAEQGLVKVSDFLELMAPVKAPADNVILVDKWLNALWYYDKGQLIKTFRVATGKHLEGPAPTAANQADNFLTPLGSYQIGFKPPDLFTDSAKIPASEPNNQVGTRWLGFSLYPGDGHRVWGIHGTSRPEEIGQWISSGTIRLTNEDMELLYTMVKEGTRLEIITSKPN